MSTPTTPIAPTGEMRLALDDIQLRENVRELNTQHVDGLARSIALRGLLVPLIVRPIDGGYQLVAGYHRLASSR
jgi:ParB-like chromosome segregation protein Spo0J